MRFTRRPKKFNTQVTVQIPKFQDGPVSIMSPRNPSKPKAPVGAPCQPCGSKGSLAYGFDHPTPQEHVGATFAKAGRIYAAVIRPVFSYGCPVLSSHEDERAPAELSQ